MSAGVRLLPQHGYSTSWR